MVNRGRPQWESKAVVLCELLEKLVVVMMLEPLSRVVGGIYKIVVMGMLSTDPRWRWIRLDELDLIILGLLFRGRRTCYTDRV